MISLISWLAPQYFRKLDSATGLRQLRVVEDSIEKIAFRTPDGFYGWLEMPFGLMNAPHMMKRVFKEYLNKL